MRMNYLFSLRGILISLLTAIVLLVSTVSPVSACEIIIESTQTTGAAGETIAFTVEVNLTHRNCIVPIEDTGFSLKNMVLLNQSPWLEVDSRTYTSEVVVQLVDEGVGILTVTRECTKGGDVVEIRIDISGSTGKEILIPPVPLEEPPQISAPEEDNSWGVAFLKAIKQPYIIAYLALTVLAYIAFRTQKRRWRLVSLTFSMIYLGFFLGMCPCVLGSLQNTLLHIGDLKTYMAQLILLSIPVISTLFWGRLFCGWVCPMGAVQQLLYRKEMAYKIPPRVHDVLKYLKYAVLLGLIIAVFISGKAIFAEVDPFKSLFNLEISLVPTTLLVITLVTSLFVFTPWCRYVCPMGAFLAILSRLSIFKLKFTESCKNCSACAKAYCSSKVISSGEQVPVISNGECTRCGECQSRCPREAIVFESGIKPVVVEEKHLIGTTSP
jgi:NosR/NirI family nitrous oxide reductase transcriptional regulator